ncbi:hypothetical protein M7I_1501 [Glarea lozoyensis 74030]|uniref:Uncharacterized protein n=1 Tax=Glarea lozoyensis (strain ATCC 74030 / MF5533) TaxID=1104152 RepID=H0EG91_GLAL7|nr:hypothetical protein M7I_1501 [Glarea lozoyensis 74030]
MSPTTIAGKSVRSLIQIRLRWRVSQSRAFEDSYFDVGKYRI